MLTSYVLQYKLIGLNLLLVENWLFALRFHVVFLMNARKWETLTDFSWIDRRYDGTTVRHQEKFPLKKNWRQGQWFGILVNIMVKFWKFTIKF